MDFYPVSFVFIFCANNIDYDILSLEIINPHKMKESCACSCCCKKNPLALTLGVFAAVAHLIWLALVAGGVAKPFADWMLGLHHIQLEWTVMSLNYANAVMLVAMAFVGGYVLGWILSTLWCVFGGCKCGK